MSERKERRLLSIRRRVPPGREAAYQRLWEDLAAGVQETGSHAWRFKGPGESDLRLEFLEFEAGRDPRADERSAASLARLEGEIARPTVEEWLEDR